MMKKLTMFLCLACAWMCSLQAQEAKTFFKNMPDSLSPLLTAVNRADCIDFLDRKSTRLNSSHLEQSRMPSSA